MENNFDKEAIILQKQMNDMLIWGIPEDKRTEEEKYRDDCKFAFVHLKEGDHPLICFVNNKDMKAYELEGYETCRLDKPIEYFKFHRWARPIDM